MEIVTRDNATLFQIEDNTITYDHSTDRDEFIKSIQDNESLTKLVKKEILQHFEMLKRKGMKCPMCEGKHLVKSGLKVRKGRRIQTYHCKTCGHVNVEHHFMK